MAPPRSQSQLAPVQPRHSRRLVAIVIVAIIILIALIVIIVWLAVRPKNLAYSIENSSISGYNFTSNGHLNATFHFLLRAKNPNKRVSYYYDNIDVKVSYKDTNLVVGNVDPFYQRRRNVTDLELNMAANDVVVQGAMAEHLKKEKASGNVKLEVKISGQIRLKVGVFKVHRSLEATCGPFAVPFSSSEGFNRVPCDVDISH